MSSQDKLFSQMSSKKSKIISTVSGKISMSPKLSFKIFDRIMYFKTESGLFLLFFLPMPSKVSKSVFVMSMPLLSMSLM